MSITWMTTARGAKRSGTSVRRSATNTACSIDTAVVICLAIDVAIWVAIAIAVAIRGRICVTSCFLEKGVRPHNKWGLWIWYCNPLNHHHSFSFSKKTTTMLSLMPKTTTMMMTANIYKTTVLETMSYREGYGQWLLFAKLPYHFLGGVSVHGLPSTRHQAIFKFVIFLRQVKEGSTLIIVVVSCILKTIVGTFVEVILGIFLAADI